VKFYVVMAVHKWDTAFELAGNPYIRVNISGTKSIGYIPLFASFEDAQIEYPGKTIRELVSPDCTPADGHE